jgi:PhnB protein
MPEPRPDPLDALRAPSGPVAPRPAFAEGLRRRIDAALADLVPAAATDAAGAADRTDPARSTLDLGRRKDTPMSTTGTSPNPIPTVDPLVGVTGLAPYLSVRDGVAALAFYRAAFGAVVDDEVPMPDGRLGHAQITIGTGATFALADEFPEMDIVGPATLGGTTVSLTLTVPDADATFARAVAAGATVEREVADQFYGARSGTVIDPFGHRWHIQTPIEDLTPDEIRRRAEEAGGDA